MINNKSIYVTTFLVLKLLIFSSCSTPPTVDPCLEKEETTGISFTSLTSFDQFKECKIGDYHNDQNWIITSQAEFEEWNQSRNCQFPELNLNFDDYIVLVGYFSHPNSGIEFINEQIEENCADETIIYTINFNTVSGGFSVLTTVNYGIVFHKLNENISYNFNLNVDNK